MTSFDRTPAPLSPEREAERIQGLLYDAITAFQFTAQLASLQHAQMRGYLAEHLATPVLAELERVRAERGRLLAVLERTQNKVADLATEAYASRPLPPRDAVCARPGCGHAGEEHHHGDTKCWANLPRTRQPNGAWSAVPICGCKGFVPSLEDPHESPLHHEFRLGRDLPETGGAR